MIKKEKYKWELFEARGSVMGLNRCVYFEASLKRLEYFEASLKTLYKPKKGGGGPTLGPPPPPGSATGL